MRIILRASSLFLSRLLSIAGFFLLSYIMSEEDFKDYAFYFSLWQISSQIIGLQIAFTLFRYSYSDAYKKAISEIASNISIIALAISASTIFAITITSNLFLACTGMAMIFSLFNMATEFCRSQREESHVFLCFAIPGISMAGIFGVFFILKDEPSRNLIICAEIAAHTIATIIACKISGVKSRFSINNLASSIATIIPAWKTVSLPLIPNNIIWYLYFNLPQILMYSKISSPDLYNKQAITLRAIVALSTIASTASLITQKPLINIYEKSPYEYQKLKSKITAKWLPTLLLVCIALSIFISHIDTSFFNSDNEVIQHLSRNIIWLSISFWLFFSNYTTAHFFIAEKNTKSAAKTMLIGFFVYISSGILLHTAGVSLTEIPIYTITAALSTTLIFRYTMTAGTCKCSKI
ncbi:hypothetical protein SAMN05216201_106123 [Pseudomonas linyingensis]|uniref:Membrane protein involved in the export of O-antigen and teichoic acid n=1 Tax=Pseudomonas linyingensis TaxID=915471 RepID=A0A1H6X9Z0_9PSED|nr:hypothetical protein [Pseudomonas linyingensis]SEJ26021.1 hypothetical protein SAMN05216201_106123 [Pseudomonas linyingensis]